MVLYGVEDDAGSVRGEVPVAQHSGGDCHGAPGVIRALPPRVGPVQPYVVQQSREAQYLRVIGDPLRLG